MSGDDYIIRATFVVDDASGPGVGQASRRVQSLESRVEQAGTNMTAALGRAFALLGGGAMFAGATRGIIGLNSEIEQTNAGMATLFSALTGTPIDRSIQAARVAVQGLREDAAKGVGELTDYTQAFQMLMGPGLAGGATPDQLRELTRNSLAAGFAMRGNAGLQFAPMDIVQALTSGVNDRQTPIANAALQSIGMDSETFRALSTVDKIETLNRAFQSFAPGVELMGQTWDAQMSTLRDSMAAIAIEATKPLFDAWTASLRGLNDWLDKSRDKLTGLARSVGKELPGLFAAATSPAGIGLAAGVGGAALVGGGAAGAGIAAAAGAGLGMVLGALQEFPALTNALVSSAADLWSTLRPLGEAFARLTAEGSVFNLVGGAIVLTVVELGHRLANMVRVLTAVVDLTSTFSRVAGLGIQGMTQAFVSLMRGDVEGARGAMASADQRSQRLIGEMNGRMLELFDPARRENRAQEGAGQLDGLLTDLSSFQLGGNTTNINGPVKIEVKAEVNEDPSRVAIAFEEIVDRLVRFPQSGRRLRGPVFG